jgi:hypothetical protein
MYTAGQIIFTKLTALALAIVTALWWHGEGFGWLTTIAAGIVAYIFWKIAIAMVVGLHQGMLIRAEMKKGGAESVAARNEAPQSHPP